MQRFPPRGIRVLDVDVDGAVEGREPRPVRFRVEPDLRRELVGPGQRGWIDHERSEPALFVDKIQVRVIVRHEATDVRQNGRTERRDVALRDHRVGHLEQRSPVIAAC